MDKQQGPTVVGPTVPTGNYIQYPVINHNGKNMKKNVYICITETLLWLTQHCKSTILQ